MQAHYDYFYQELPTDSIDVDDIGNVCLQANNDDAQFYFLIVRTELGVTRVVEYGPYIDGGFPLNLSYTFQQFDYNESRIDKLINKFLNNPVRKITQVEETQIEEIHSLFKSPLEYMYDD